MKNTQKTSLYRSSAWYSFSDQVQKRDNYKCLNCGRGKDDVILQTHHRFYKENLKPWEYPLSDCITLCKGCHAREHNLVEPTDGWILVSIDDLGDLIGTCERKGCGSNIRYEHLIYHPKWGYMSVGSTCVEYLTTEDKYISTKTIDMYRSISNFIKNSEWKTKLTKTTNKRYYYIWHKNHQIKIYSYNKKYRYEFMSRELYGGYGYSKRSQPLSKTLDQVKEISYVHLKAKIISVIKHKSKKEQREFQILKSLLKMATI